MIYSHAILFDLPSIPDTDDIEIEAVLSAITLSEEDAVILQELKENSFIGDYAHIATEIETMAKRYGTWTDDPGRQMIERFQGIGPAFLYDRRAFIRSDLLPNQDFIEITLTHEVVESLFSQYDHATATQSILHKLGLTRFTKGKDGQHFVAMLFELYEANNRGILNEWLTFRNENDLIIPYDKKDDQNYLENIKEQKQAREYVAALVRKLDRLP